MRKETRLGLLSCFILGAAACAAPGNTGSAPEPVATGAAAQSTTTSGPLLDLDLGSSDPTQVISVSIIFKVTDTNALEAFVQSTQEPGSPSYHQFLSVRQFAGQFAPSAGAIERVANYLTPFGITVGSTLADNLVLKATGTIGAFTQAFTFTMNDFQHGSTRYHRPTLPPHLPSALSDVMLVVAGFSTQPAATAKSIRASQVSAKYAPPVVLPKNSTATGVPGNYTVGDFANNYDVNPLYAAGITGRGSTIGIATLSNFAPADAYAYWSGIGLTVSQTRITQVHVDGGGAIDGGSGETTLDTEQSGGLAPGANIVVYDAPNTDGGFLDLFYTAASDNLVDSLSCSWGEAELFYNAALNGTDFTIELQAFHQAFLEAAAQGISTFASSGDSGAYDYAENGIPGLSNVLSVDAPASDPAITAAGGTTTPYTVNDAYFGVTGTASYTVTKEQVWGWDGLQTFFDANIAPGYSLFSTGSGGGVSVYWPVPWYQQGYPGVQESASGQVITYNDGVDPVQTLLDVPANYKGRNVPDVSADADPFSGYLLYVDGQWQNGWGGTSFVAPQLNGVTALLRQKTHGRVGLLNAAFYRYA
ncbi:MAG: S53 family peptidase, partial [Polyangiaceae bacterium]